MADSWFARRSQKETDRLTELGVQFKKRPEEGKMRHIAFIYDPDRYWIGECTERDQCTKTSLLVEMMADVLAGRSCHSRLCRARPQQVLSGLRVNQLRWIMIAYVEIAVAMVTYV